MNLATPADSNQQAGASIVVQADARHLPLPDASVDLVVTSPPYWRLRSYHDAGTPYAGQIGSEATPAEYIAALVECTREWMRVLKPTGSLWVNLGDRYSTGNSGESGLAKLGEKWAGGGHSDGKAKRHSTRVPGRPPKSLLGLPWRYALACIDQLGLILRAEVIWSKRNGTPESVTDRVRRSHEQWFHLTQQPRYYSAVDEIRQPSNPRNIRPQDRRGEQSQKDAIRRANGYGTIGHPGRPLVLHPLGKLPGSVREVSSEPLKVPPELGIDHFAAFPSEWPRWIITGWSPPGICVQCGEGRRPLYDRQFVIQSDCTIETAWKRDKHYAGNNWRDRPRGRTDVCLAGYACACPEPTAPTRPAVVLDPFGGTGTTALVAALLGRIGITVDRSADYCRLAQWRTTDPGERAKILKKLQGCR